MGTRGLTVVVLNGEHRVAQYGQWDHYPAGQGVTALKFCCKHLSTPEGREKFRAAVAATRYIDRNEYELLWKSLGVNLNENGGFVSCADSNRFSEKFPHLHRDCGAKVLECVLNGATELQGEIEFGFGGEGGFLCEGIYLVNLDNRNLEVYYGESPVDYKGAMHRLGGKGSAVPLVAVFDLDDLPPVSKVGEIMERLESMLYRMNYPAEFDGPKDTPEMTGKDPRETALLAMGRECKDMSIHRGAARKRIVDLLNGECPYDPSMVADLNVTEMLTDLRHYCDTQGLDFAKLSRASSRRYKAQAERDAEYETA